MRTVKELTSRELDVLGAWWHLGSVVEAARFLNLHPQTAKNALHQARIRTGVPTTLALARLYSKDLPTPAVLRKHAKKAA